MTEKKDLNLSDDDIRAVFDSEMTRCAKLQSGLEVDATQYGVLIENLDSKRKKIDTSLVECPRKKNCGFFPSNDVVGYLPMKNGESGVQGSHDC